MTDIDEKVDKLPSTSASAANPPKIKKKTNGLLALGIIGVAALVLFAGEDPLISFPEEEITPETIFNPADVHLYTFSDPYDNDSVNVEFWLLNIGEEIATEIEVYVRVRDHNGTILFSEIVDTTTLLLRENETCSGDYIVEYDDAEYLTHTIEVSWDDGRNSYSKKTNLRVTTVS